MMNWEPRLTPRIFQVVLVWGGKVELGGHDGKGEVLLLGQGVGDVVFVGKGEV